MLHMVEFEQINDEVGDKDVGYHVTTDDFNAAGQVVAPSGTKIYLYVGEDGGVQASLGTQVLFNGQFSSVGYHTLYIWVQLLSAPGTNQNVNGYVTFDKFGRP